MRRDGLSNVRKIVEKVLDAQFRGMRISVKDLLPSEDLKSKGQASDGAVYNALRVLTKADILNRRYTAGRKKSLEIDYEKAFEDLALHKTLDNARRVEALPEEVRIKAIRKHRDILRAEARTEYGLITELFEKYGSKLDEWPKVHEYMIRSVVETVIQFIEKWETEKEPVKRINYVLITGIARENFDQYWDAYTGQKSRG